MHSSLQIKSSGMDYWMY